MEMRFIGNADKGGRNHRMGLAKKLAGVLLAGAMIATNFGGIEPGVVHAANPVEVYNIGDLFDYDSSSTFCYSKGGSYVLKNDIIDGVDLYYINTDTTIDLGGYNLRLLWHFEVNSTLCIIGNGGQCEHLSVSPTGHLNISGGQVNLTSNQGTVSVSGGSVYIENNSAGFTQTGGNVVVLNNNETYTQTGGYCEFYHEYGNYIQTGGTNPNNKTINLDANGGNPATSTATTVTTSAGEKFYSLPAVPFTGPAATPYFDGWYTAPDDSGELVTTNRVFAGSETIYAHWTDVPPTGNSATSSNSSASNTTEGALTSENSSVDTTKDYLDELTEKLEDAIKAGGAQTIYWNEGTALPGPVMKMLQENPQITLVFSYTYEGLDYVVTLPGKYVKYDPNVPWCGPLYLYGLYGKYGTTTAPVATTTQVGERSYTVISGETLWGIAMRLGTTVEELVRLNNITNPDRIDIGQIIRY